MSSNSITIEDLTRFLVLFSIKWVTMQDLCS